MSTENSTQQAAGTQSDDVPDDEPYFGPHPGGNDQGQQREQQQPQLQINEIPTSPQHIPVAVSGTSDRNQGDPQAEAEEDGARQLDRRRLQMMAIGIDFASVPC